MVLLTMVDKRFRLCFANTAVTIPTFNKTHVENYDADTIHVDKEKCSHCKYYDTKTLFMQKDEHKIFALRRLPYGSSYSG